VHGVLGDTARSLLEPTMRALTGDPYLVLNVETRASYNMCQIQEDQNRARVDICIQQPIIHTLNAYVANTDEASARNALKMLSPEGTVHGTAAIKQTRAGSCNISGRWACDVIDALKFYSSAVRIEKVALRSWGNSAACVYVEVDGKGRIGTLSTTTFNLMLRFRLLSDECGVSTSTKGQMIINANNTENTSSPLIVESDGFLRFSGLPEFSPKVCKAFGDMIRRCISSDRMPEFMASLRIMDDANN
jgi:hypothetical protein